MENSRHCPRQQVTAADYEWAPHYQCYRAGFLYRDGGVRKQPAVYLAAMRLIDSITRAEK